MGIRTIPYRTLEALLASEPIVDEDPSTAELIHRLAHVKRDRVLTRREFLDICHWKSPRSIRTCERNSARMIRSIAGKVFATRDEQKRMEVLTRLHGVSIPTASAILTLTNPRRYGVIDIRVWQLLFALRSVTSRPSGQGFRLEHWDHYLKVLRKHAAQLNVSVRRLELTLFQYHQKYQKGTLY